MHPRQCSICNFRICYRGLHGQEDSDEETEIHGDPEDSRGEEDAGGGAAARRPRLQGGHHEQTGPSWPSLCKYITQHEMTNQPIVQPTNHFPINQPTKQSTPLGDSQGCGHKSPINCCVKVRLILLQTSLHHYKYYIPT